MKLNVLEPILDYDGKPVKISDKENLTWRKIIFNALNNISPEEKQIDSETKSRCYQITKKIYDSKDPDLTVNERALILERIDKAYNSPLVCGKAKEFFEEKK